MNTPEGQKIELIKLRYQDFSQDKASRQFPQQGLIY